MNFFLDMMRGQQGVCALAVAKKRQPDPFLVQTRRHELCLTQMPDLHLRARDQRRSIRFWPAENEGIGVSALATDYLDLFQLEVISFIVPGLLEMGFVDK